MLSGTKLAAWRDARHGISHKPDRGDDSNQRGIERMITTRRTVRKMEIVEKKKSLESLKTLEALLGASEANMMAKWAEPTKACLRELQNIEEMEIFISTSQLREFHLYAPENTRHHYQWLLQSSERVSKRICWARVESLGPRVEGGWVCVLRKRSLQMLFKNGGPSRDDRWCFMDETSLCVLSWCLVERTRTISHSYESSDGTHDRRYGTEGSSCRVSNIQIYVHCSRYRSTVPLIQCQ